MLAMKGVYPDEEVRKEAERQAAENLAAAIKIQAEADAEAAEPAGLNRVIVEFLIVNFRPILQSKNPTI